MVTFHSWTPHCTLCRIVELIEAELMNNALGETGVRVYEIVSMDVIMIPAGIYFSVAFPFKSVGLYLKANTG